MFSLRVKTKTLAMKHLQKTVIIIKSVHAINNVLIINMHNKNALVIKTSVSIISDHWILFFGGLYAGSLTRNLVRNSALKYFCWEKKHEFAFFFFFLTRVYAYYRVFNSCLFCKHKADLLSLFFTMSIIIW